MFASGGFDKTLRLWDAESRKCLVVIQNFQDTIRGIVWLTGNYLVAGSEDGSVLKWHVGKKKGQYRVKLKWCSTKGSLNLTGASMHDVQGLTKVNIELLKQRGAGY
jgi:WD40 repeat protein